MRHSCEPFPEVATPLHRFECLRAGGLLLAILITCVAPAHGDGATPTSTTISVTPGGSVTQGTVLTLQAAVDSDGAVTSGSVTFYDGTKALASVQLGGTGAAFTHGTANTKLRLGRAVTCSRLCIPALALI